MAVEVGDQAPDFELSDQHGTPVRLSGFRGSRHVVLVFYPLAFSGVCTGELRAIRDGFAELARDELGDITRLTEAIDALATRIGEHVRQVAPELLAVPGCGELTAAKLVGEAAGVNRFKSEAAFARHAGVAPIPVWSGNTAGRVRMTRSGNRQLNAALHRIAVTQIRLDGLGQTYYHKRIQAGDSKTEALRCLKRRLARVVFRHLHTDENNRLRPCQPAAA